MALNNKLNIYVGVDLKRRMDAAAASDTSINWSAVAQQAFEAKLRGDVVVDVPTARQRLRVTVEFID